LVISDFTTEESEAGKEEHSEKFDCLLGNSFAVLLAVLAICCGS
jgi:hypothetical protein